MNDSPLYLAFETGGTKLVTGVAGSDMRILASESVQRAASDRAPRSFRRVMAAAHGILATDPFRDRTLRAVGFGFGGTVRRSTNSPHLCLHEDGWNEVDVVGELKRRFRVPVFVENDCKLAALAEAHFGAGAGASSLFYITLGTGVGGGFVKDGGIFACGDLGEAEIGHIVVEPDGLPCCCGSRGCVEAMCSGPGLVKLCGMLANRHPGEWRSSAFCDSDREAQIRSELIVRHWERGDRFASRVMQTFAGRLALAVAAMVNLLVPERIVIGGGLGTSSPRLLELISARVRPLVVPYFRESFEVVGSMLHESVVTQGAVIYAAQQIR